MIQNKTIAISCAGMGTRLGIGTTKALIDVDGKPLIIRQLEQLIDYEDVRVIVGYQAEQVIETVKAFRKDVTFCFNYDYKMTGAAASLSKALIGSRKIIVTLVGDLLVHPDDMKRFLAQDENCVGGVIPTTDNPVLMTLDANNCVIEFSRERGSLEWTGLAQIHASLVKPGKGHVYQLLEALMPIKVMNIRAKEIDTVNDYENAVAWVKNGYCG